MRCRSTNNGWHSDRRSIGKIVVIDLAEIDVGDLPVDQDIDCARQVERNPERTGETIGRAKWQHAEYDAGVGKMVDHRTDGAVSTANDDELAPFGNFFSDDLRQPLRVPNRIGCIEYHSRFC